LFFLGSFGESGRIVYHNPTLLFLPYKQEILGRTKRLLSFDTAEPHRKPRIQQFLYCCVYILCRGNVFTEPLPINDRGIHIQSHRVMGGIYELRR
jgi:hypothetical protein